jgi:hypothetical protein
MTTEYVAAYEAETGVIIAMGTPSAIRGYAEQAVADLQARDSTNDYFVAERESPSWRRSTAR